MTKEKIIHTLEYTKRNCGLPEQGDGWSSNAETKALDVAIDCVNLVDQYKELGSPSELLAALEFIKDVKNALEQDCAYPEDIEFNIRDAYQEYMDELQLSKDYQNNQFQK